MHEAIKRYHGGMPAIALALDLLVEEGADKAASLLHNMKSPHVLIGIEILRDLAGLFSPYSAILQATELGAPNAKGAFRRTVCLCIALCRGPRHRADGAARSRRARLRHVLHGR